MIWITIDQHHYPQWTNGRNKRINTGATKNQHSFWREKPCLTHPQELSKTAINEKIKGNLVNKVFLAFQYILN